MGDMGEGGTLAWEFRFKKREDAAEKPPPVPPVPPLVPPADDGTFLLDFSESRLAVSKALPPPPLILELRSLDLLEKIPMAYMYALEGGEGGLCTYTSNVCMTRKKKETNE